MGIGSHSQRAGRRDTVADDGESDINGSTTMLSSETAKGSVTVGFCVTGISDGAGEGVGLIDYTGPEICVP